MAANETTTPTGQAALLRELGILIAPLEDLQSGMAAAELVRELGYDFPLATAFPVDFASLLEDVEQVAEDVVALEQASDDDEQLDAAIQLAVDLVPLIEAIVKLEQDLEDGLAAMQTLVTQSDITTKLPVRLLDYLVIRYLIERAGPTFDLLLLAGLVDFVHQEADKPKFKLEALIPKVYWERLPKLFTSPSALLDQAYDWSENFNADLMVVRLAGAGRRLGLPMGTAPQSDQVSNALGRPEGSHELRLALLQAGQLVPAAGYGELGLRAFALPPTGNLAPGIAIMPYAAGAAAVTGHIGSWEVELDTTLDLSGGVAAIIRPPKFLEVKTDLLGTPGTTTSATLGVKVSRKSDSPDGMILLGSPGATRMSVGEFGLGFATSLGTQNEVVLEVSIVDLLILVVAGDGDGFLQKMLPGDGIKAQASLDASYSSLHGLKLKGSGSLEVDLPIGLEIAGIIRIDDLIVALGFTETELNLSLAVNGGLSIGPVAASVEGIGIRAGLEPKTDNSGNAGPLAVHVGFKPPTGLGASVDAGPVTGGGFLFFDDAKEEYGGGIELGFQAFHIVAIGLLTTKMPDGSKGFSLIVVIAVEFNPIQLGYGFTLNGVGGLVGIHRGINVEYLRTGLKDGTLDSIRFPHDVAANAPKILGDLRNSFPVQEDQYVFGPMVRIGWGASMITLDIGLVLELPSPIRLLIIGTLKLMVPPIDEEAVLRLQLDLLGVIDFDKGEVSFDGSIRNSRVAAFPISGDMAMRLSVGQQPTFGLSAGGFHPSFPVPPNFPKLDRLAIAIMDGENPRLRLEAYKAITANSFQMGARIDLFVQKDLGSLGDFTVQGYLGFDALVKFSPFSFIVEMGGQFSIKRNGAEFAAVGVNLTLSGPQPWHAVGTASFKVMGFSASVGFDLTVGEPPPPFAIAPVDPLGLLLAALEDKTNWSANPLDDVHAVVAIREQAPSEDVVVHPLGTLTVRQRVVPLDFQLEVYGQAELAGGRFSFGIEAITIGGAEPRRSELRDQFAPGDFLRLTDEQKLARPSFEKYKAGYSIGSPGLEAGARAQANFGYRQYVIDDPDDEPRELAATGKVSPTALASVARSGAPVRSSGQTRYAGTNAPVSVGDVPYAVARKDTLGAETSVESTGDTYAETETARQSADDSDELQVVGAHEVV